MASQLTREQKMALATILQNLKDFDLLVSNAEQLGKESPLLHSNFMAASYSPIEVLNIPKQQHWCWNQSNAKIEVNVGDQMTISLRKFSPRKNPSSVSQAPSLKMWLYEIKLEEEEKMKYFLWCEKGVATVTHHMTLSQSHPAGGIQTEIGIIFPESVSLEELSFLKQFIEERMAEELGW